MERAQVNGATLEYEVWGTGEPVVLIHGSILADAFAPLFAQPAVSGRYRLVSYHRRGFAGSSRADGPVSIAQQAADCRALMQQLNIEQAHIVGHSYGGTIALQLALDAPASVHSLVLLEPAGLPVPSAEQLFQTVGAAAQTFAAGDAAGAIDAFMRGVVTPDYRQVLGNLPPGAEEQALADAGTLFQVELPALQEWGLTREQAARITRPALSVLGTESSAVWPGFGEGHRLLKEWLPRVEAAVIPNATHMLQMQNPRAVAEALAGFFARHPLPVTV